MAFDIAPLLERFETRFPEAQGFVHCVRAPGRMNIVGEHTDYNGLPVLPFAIDAAVWMVVAPTDAPVVTLDALDFPATSPASFLVGTDIEPSEQGHWINYVKAAVQDGAREAAEHGLEPRDLTGFCGVVGGDLPKNAGLSSSSALVVGAALAFRHFQGWEIDPPALALRCAAAEHYVGTRGGGMDQTVSLCGRRDACLKLYFHPLELTEVSSRVDCSFVVAHSGVEAAKSAGARHHYNQRVLECRLLTALLGEALNDGGGATGCPDAKGTSLAYLGDLRRTATTLDRIDALRDAALDALDREAWTWAELETRLGRERLDALVRDGRFEELLPNLPERLPLRRRAKYLFEEWARVERAAEALERGAADELGALLYAAHAGLANEYEVSHPKVDDLIELARAYGLPGARMVGAGFGGSTLHLVPRGEERAYMGYLAERFYGEPLEALDGRALHIFHPSAGASLEAV